MICAEHDCRREATHINAASQLACLGHAMIRATNRGATWHVLGGEYGAQAAVGFQWLNDNPNPKRAVR